jgi:hypothetical protein
MRLFVRKMLRGGVPLALVAAAVGYGLASFVGGLADAQVARRPDSGTPPSQVMKVRLPLAMALGSVGLLALLEAPAAFLRSRRRGVEPPAPVRTPTGLDSEVEALLNRIQEQTTAENDDTAEVPAVHASPAGAASR